MKIIKVNVVDTETTGFKPPPNGDIVEIAVTELIVSYNGDELADIRMGNTFESYAKPGHPIDLQAMAVHHITEDMVKDAKPAKEVRESFAGMAADFWVAHNMIFDQKFFQPKNGRLLCSMKAAQAIFPDAPAYKLQILRYWLKLDRLMKPERMGDTHRAGFDTYITAILMSQLLLQNKMTLDDMANLHSNPIQLGKIQFGKHKGTRWAEVPKSYLSWLVKNSEDDQIKATCRHFLK